MARIPYIYRKLRAYGVPAEAAELMSDPNEDLLDTGIQTAVDEYLDANPPGGGTGAVDSVNTRTGNVVLTSADVGLGNATNTSDANKPISTAQQTALDLKAPLASPTFTGTVSGVTKTHVGLGNVDNTTDALKPVSTATQTALDLKAPIAGATFTGTTTVATLAGATKSMVGLGNVDNTTDAGKPISTATQTALDLKSPLASPTFTGTVSGITKTMVGLGNVDNVSDANAPVSTAQQTALDLKAPLASPTFTGTVSGVTKTHVSLGNVDNTSDANKPVSTAQQTALDLKANLASPTFTGTVAGVTKTHVGLSNVTNVDQGNGSNISSGVVGAAFLDTEKVVTWATGSEPSLAGIPDGTLWVEYTP